MTRRALQFLAALLALAALAAGGAAVAAAVEPAAEPASPDPIICDELPCIPPPTTTTGGTTTQPPPPGTTGTTTTTTTGSADSDGDGSGDPCDSTLPSYVSNGELDSDAAAGTSSRTLTGSTACRSAWGYVQWWTAGRLVKQFEYRLAFTYCYQKNVRVTAIRDVLGFSAHAMWPWSFAGTTVGPVARNVGSYSASVFAQARYEGCVFSWGCIVAKHPWLEITVTATSNVPTVRIGFG
jgi:hypothetical protein